MKTPVYIVKSGFEVRFSKKFYRPATLEQLKKTIPAAMKIFLKHSGKYCRIFFPKSDIKTVLECCNQLLSSNR